MHIVQVNYAYAADLEDPEALLDRFSTLTGWSEAVLRELTGQAGPGQAGKVGTVTVVQRFTRDAIVSRDGVEYVFRREAGGPLPPRWAWCPSVARAVAERNPEIVHVNGLGFPMPTWWLRRGLQASTALVVQDHAGGPPGQGWLRWLLCRRLTSAADGFMFTAREQAIPWQDARLLSPERVYEVLESSTALSPIPRGAAVDQSRHATLRGAPALLWVGRLNANKDPLTILDAFVLALHHLPDAMLTMVFGEQELEEAVRRRIEQSAALQSRVRLAGRVPAGLMPAFYSAADLFVLGSHHEGSGYALLEALACGVVPVVTDIAAFRAITDRGSIGRLWPPGDAARCARALVEAANLDLASERSRVLEHFEQNLCWPAVGRRAVEIYREVLSRRRSLIPDP